MIEKAMPGFRDLQNYTTLKHELELVIVRLRFRDLQNYTTLKPNCKVGAFANGFRDLQNYTTLKQIV